MPRAILENVEPSLAAAVAAKWFERLHAEMHLRLALLTFAADGPFAACLGRLDNVVRQDRRRTSGPDLSERVDQLVEALDVGAVVRVEPVQRQERVEAVEDDQPAET